MTRRELVSRWLPVAAWMLLIFVLSAQPNLRQAVPESIKEGMPQIYTGHRWRQLTVNEVAHPAEYIVLTVLLVRAMTGNRRGGNALVYAGALGISAVYIWLDEVHQSFVPGRAFQVQDLVLDFAGALLGLLLAWLFYRVRGCLIHRRAGATP